jgi:hypothetical protein
MTTSSTSEHGGFIRGQAAEIDGAGDAIDAALTRVCVNNLQHLTDQSGQFLACMTPTTGEYLEQAAPSTTTMALIGGAEWRFPLRVRSGDVSSFRVVVYMRAYISAAGTATFRLALRQVDHMVYTVPPDPASFSTPWVAEVSTTSTTGADLTATLYVPAAMVGRRFPWSAWQSEDGGAAPEQAYGLFASLQVWAKSSNGASLPRIMSLTAREYSGDR